MSDEKEIGPWPITFRGEPFWSNDAWIHAVGWEDNPSPGILKSPRIKIGDAWWSVTEERWAEPEVRKGYNEWMSIDFARLNRRPITLRMPDGSDFCIDSRVSNSDAGHGWTVTLQEPPLVGQRLQLSLSPSVVLSHGRYKDGQELGSVETYHGWVGVNGVLVGHIGPDLSGKRYPLG